jgi:hypothetical protein
VRPGLRPGEADHRTVVIELGPEAEAVLGVVSALARRQLLVHRQLGRGAAVELHDVAIGENPVPGEGILIGGDTQPDRGRRLVHLVLTLQLIDQ